MTASTHDLASMAARPSPPGPTSPSSDCFVSVVAPLYNDGDIVVSFVNDVVEVVERAYRNYELVLVDDGSTDDTVEQVTALLERVKCLRLVRLSRRFGRDIAISAGLDVVIGDFVAVLVPETDPPALIPDIIEKCRRTPGIVYGIRAHRPAESLLMRVGTRVFYWYFNRILGLDLPLNSTDFRAYSRQTVNAITRIKDRLRYLRTFGTYVGYGSEPYVYEPQLRRARARGRSPGEGLGLALNMTVANSTRPLRIVSLLGLGLSVLSAAYAVWVVILRALNANLAEGWATQQAFTALMFMFVFLILATICEYVGRLLGEVRDRPLYFVLEERGSSTLFADEERKNVVTESR